MIDYNLINESILYYEKLGFNRIETPWLVTEYIDSITRDKNTTPFWVESKNKNLVASGEQSFLYLYLKEQLPRGKFQTVTPCFRNDSFDLTHTKYFIKNELIQTDKTEREDLLKIVKESKVFFDSLFKKETNIQETNDGFDICIDDYELGSYGIRECDFIKWIYATGCAEPRTSKLIKIYNGLSY